MKYQKFQSWASERLVEKKHLMSYLHGSDEAERIRRAGVEGDCIALNRAAELLKRIVGVKPFILAALLEMDVSENRLDGFLKLFDDVEFEIVEDGLIEMVVDNEVHRRFDGSLYMDGARVKNLPRLDVSGDITLNNSTLESLSLGTRVGGNLEIENTNVSLLPMDLVVMGDVYIYGSRVSNIPDSVDIRGFICIKEGQLDTVPLGMYDQIRPIVMC